jgi:hypothetical protein
MDAEKTVCLCGVIRTEGRKLTTKVDFALVVPERRLLASVSLASWNRLSPEERNKRTEDLCSRIDESVEKAVLQAIKEWQEEKHAR